MSSRPVSGQGSFTWSLCSTQYLQHFLNSSKSSCLQKSPSTVYMNGRSNDKPGQVYDANSQCKLAFNDSLNECPGKLAECKMLWCLRPLFSDGKARLRCTSNLIPKMDGTNCGEGKWCEHGECVDRYADTRSFIVHNKTRNRISTVKCFGISCLGKTNSNDFSDDNTIFEDPVRFKSPNFPDDYPKDTDQSYIIKAPRDHVVDIEFYVFHLEQHSLCLYDYLQIFDVSSEEYSIFCGLLLTPFHMTSQGSVLRLEFHSDTNVQKPGFLAKIIFLPSFVMNNS
ncbi:dorsal-ventral patterning protein tolloid-like [Anneissia japonica]|uniref:dorsal-ventral patterning protein tolloid-like n=1 Tax=Anneissia japonica TaxID=1529436 RepID=UPI001425A9D8|nr:dorsal-ventral patterning protein tolloid-like [Anneissia japonica]